MDENTFRNYFKKKTVFKQASSLDQSFVPEKLYCRDDVIENLIFNFRRIFDEKEQPSISVLLLGKGGVGKTVTARFFGKNLKPIALENDVNLFVEYFNCINYDSKSKIIREVLAKKTFGSGRGYSDDEGLKLILSQLIRERSYMLLIIDEIFRLKPDEILALLDIAETFGHQNAKLSLIIISRTHDWMTVETERILSRLNQKIELKPYNYDEAKQILDYRSELALKENIIDDDLLEMIAEIVSEHQNMRHGIEILRKSGLYCDKEGLEHFTPEIVREASNEVYPTFRGDVIDLLKDQELLALYGIVRALINTDESCTLVDEAYEEYQVICENYSIEPHVKMSFRKYVRHLDELKIITSKTVRIEEAQRGRHKEIGLLDIPAAKLSELLEGLFERKFMN